MILTCVSEVLNKIISMLQRAEMGFADKYAQRHVIEQYIRGLQYVYYAMTCKRAFVYMHFQTRNMFVQLHWELRSLTSLDTAIGYSHDYNKLLMKGLRHAKMEREYDN